MKLLAMCDSPTETTGFGKVAANLLREWRPYFRGGIDVWGINYLGWPHGLPYRIFPGGCGGWNSPGMLQRFLELIVSGDYTHVWIMQDTFALSRNKFPKALRDVCRAKKVRSLLYFPVDAPLEPEWTEIVWAVDVAVAYTEYGRREAERWEKRQFIHVLPHGVDREVFKPLFDGMTRAEKVKARGELRAKLYAKELAWGGFEMTAEDRLLVNVNSNSRRKGLAQSLEILAALKNGEPPLPGPPSLCGYGAAGPLPHRMAEREKMPAGGQECPRSWKLLMHMEGGRPDDQTDLELAGRQLGLVYGVDWKHTGGPNGYWKNGFGLVTEAGVNQIYNSADGVLTTSYGEGWGFSITEGLAAEVPVFCPAHTSCGEIAVEVAKRGSSVASIQLLPVGRSAVMLPMDNSRLRYPVDSAAAARVVADGVDWAESKGVGMSKETRRWLSWGRIAGEWIELFKGR